jgi:putative membrane protein
VKFAEKAIEKTGNPEVKQLAQTIKNDHNKCLQKLMTQAEKQNLSVVQGLSKEHQEIANRLNELESNEFDREYVRGVIDRHQKMTKYSDEQVKNGKDEEITKMCKEAKDVVKGHLDAARKVQANLNR